MAHGAIRAARMMGRGPTLLLTALLAGCAPDLPEDAAHGRALIAGHGCGTCHVIPGIATARGRAGPTLEAIGRRAYLGGVAPNTPERMAQWLMQPHHVDPGTAMPALGVAPAEAAAMAAYLETLR